MKIKRKLYFVLIILFIAAISPALFKIRALMGILLPIIVFIPILLLSNKTMIKIWQILLFLLPILSFFLIFACEPSSKGLIFFLNYFFLFLAPVASIVIYSNCIIIKYLYKIFAIFIFSIFLIAIFQLLFYFHTIPIHHYQWLIFRSLFTDTIDFHGTYLSLYYTIPIIFILNEFKEARISILKFLLYFFILIILFFSLFVINSRAIILGVSIVTLVYILQIIKRLNIISKFLTIILVLSGLIFLLQRNIQDFKYYIVDENYKEFPRMALYESANYIIKQDGLFIFRSPEKLQKELNYFYNKLEYSDIVKENLKDHNVHNQYLNFFLLGSFPLLISFLITLIYKFILCARNKNLLYFSIVFMFSLVCFSENILSRQYGIYLWTLCDVFFFGLVFKNDKFAKLKT